MKKFRSKANVAGKMTERMDWDSMHVLGRGNNDGAVVKRIDVMKVEGYRRKYRS